ARRTKDPPADGRAPQRLQPGDRADQPDQAAGPPVVTLAPVLIDYTQGVEKSVDRVLVTLDASGKSQNRRWMVGRLPRIQPQLSTASVDDDVRVDLCRRGLSTPSTAPMNTASPSMLTRPIQSGHATFCGQPDRHVACP